MSTTAVIRPAELADLPAITDIYNEAILTSTATFDTEPKTLDDRRQWFQAHSERHPILVAELSGRVIGWASLTPWSDRRAYDETAETSFYVQSESRGHGIGRGLHEDPHVPCLGKAGTGVRLVPGMVLALEVMATVCSKCAESDPSFVTTVQPSAL